MKKVIFIILSLLLVVSVANAKMTNLRITWEDEGVGTLEYEITYEQGSTTGVVTRITDPTLREVTVNNIDMPSGMVTFYITAYYQDGLNVSSDPYRTVIGKPRILGIVTF